MIERRTFFTGAAILFFSMPAFLWLEKNGTLPVVYPLQQAICDVSMKNSCAPGTNK